MWQRNKTSLPFRTRVMQEATIHSFDDAMITSANRQSTDASRYILAPKDICGRGCINETFRVLKDNEIREFGEYRTKRLVMDAWNWFGYNN